MSFWQKLNCMRALLAAFAERQRPRGLHGFRWLQTIRSSVRIHVVEWLARGRDELRTSSSLRYCCSRLVVEYVLKKFVLASADMISSIVFYCNGIRSFQVLASYQMWFCQKLLKSAKYNSQIVKIWRFLWNLHLVAPKSSTSDFLAF